MRLSRSIPLVLFLFALSDLALRQAPLSWFAYRAIEGIGRGHPSYEPFLPNSHYENRRSYGDLAGLGNLRRLREYRHETTNSDQWGYRKTVGLKDAIPSAILIGDSFGVAPGVSDSETLPSRLSSRCGANVYNAAGGGRWVGWPQIEEIADRLGMQQGFLIHEVLERGKAPPPGPSQPSRSKSKPVADAFAASPSLAERKRAWVEGSRLRILAERFYRLAQNDLILPNPYRQNVILGELENGDSILFHPAELKVSGIARPISTDYWRWLQSAAAARHLELVVLLVPDKYTVYEPFLKTRPSEQPGADYLERLETALTRAGVPVVNLKRSFSEVAREGLANRSYLYFLDDTHWNAKGIDLAAQQLLPALACGPGQRRPNPLILDPVR